MSRWNSGSEAQATGVQADKWMRWMIAFAVMVAAIMELVDTSAVNVSLPYIAGNLSSPVDEATWVLTSHLVANAMLSYLDGFRVMAVLLFAAAPFVWIMKKPHFK
ncbi:MAG TPA: hypothetical protein VHY48_05055 [Acidobacteriaceae bacterium]|jgi:DHA2 family multidrug resistance protein|nr:hypothetical protein [Acidobacteriaceae bacterium]